MTHDPTLGLPAEVEMVEPEAAIENQTESSVLAQRRAHTRPVESEVDGHCCPSQAGVMFGVEEGKRQPWGRRGSGNSRDVVIRAGIRLPRWAWMTTAWCAALTTGIILWLRQPAFVDMQFPSQSLRMDARPEVIVVDGSHRVRIDGDRIDATAVDPDDSERQFAWLRGELRFNGESLEEVVDEFNRYNPIRLRIADPKIRSLPVYGAYRARDPEGFAWRIQHSLGVRFEVKTGVRGLRTIDLEEKK